MNYETYKAAEAAVRDLLREWRREIFDAIVNCEGPDTVREWLDTYESAEAAAQELLTEREGGRTMLNDCVNVHNKKQPRFAEIFKLAAELAERGIAFRFEYLTGGGLNRCYLWYLCGQPLPITIAQGEDTFGFEDGLLEINGLLTAEEAEKNEDCFLGWLTAENVLERILKNEAQKTKRDKEAGK